MKRVVITGVGVVSCLGNNQDEVYKSLLNSKSGITFSEEYKEYNLKLFELHFDLDGKGWEFKDSKHCWLPFQIKELVNFINNEKEIEGKYHKKPSSSEYKERLYRSDPVDGLRPNIKIRNS